MQPHARGFTLVEVLVALAVLAIVAALGWRGLDAISKSREISQARLDEVARVDTLLAQWQDDLRQLAPAVDDIPMLDMEGPSLRLLRTTPGGVQVVAWIWHEGTLWRTAEPPATRREALRTAWQHSQQPVALRREGRLAVLSGVESWRVEVHRDGTWLPAAALRAREGGPPMALRLVLQLRTASGLSGPLQRDVLLGPLPS